MEILTMAKKNDTTVEKKVRNGIDTFLPAYLQATVDGVTLEDFAASINVAPLTVYQRVAKLRAGGLDVPMLEGQTGTRVSVNDKAAAILAQFNAANG
jgi:hypothetical protein